MKTWFAKAEVEKLACPAQNPDFNLTEPVGDELEHRLHFRSPKPHNELLATLCTFITERPWDKFVSGYFLIANHNIVWT